DQAQLDPRWIIDPKTKLPVPWMWTRALGTAWERYHTDDGTLGQAFGLEGGQGKPPISDKLTQMLNERAIARWIFSRIQEAKTAGREERRDHQTCLATVWSPRAAAPLKVIITSPKRRRVSPRYY